MDQAIRNKLRNVVTQCRKLLEDAVAQVLQGQFGIYATGKKDEVHVDDEVKMKHLSDEDRAYRKDILDHLEHVKALGYKPTDSLAQLVREIAFTHLNRFCAYKMMEARSLIRESVSKGLKSQGFLFYLADHDDDEKRANSGQQDVAYRHFINWLGGTLSEEIGVLFNPHDSANRLYPPQRVLDDVLNLLNDEALADIWTQDETIGWVYQYFTPKELRDQVRKESQAPRNSYELAFRNQFFTPRYVVEFLTDNTLGRIWYEMRKGDTKLKDQCRYMVRRPNEIFLKGGQQQKDAAEGRDELSQEELLKLPVYISHRPKKDPRELKILDPACGSGHFLLYCFDLLLTIYEEAYGDPELGPALQQDYPTLDALKRDVPRLILAHNLHGIDIDLRASQIAALALWLRCQRAYQEMGLKKDRPKINRSNFVCAEPMPGEPAMLKEFVGQLEPRLLGQLVEVVFDKMKLAGEAGSLLKIEEEIRTAVASAKQQWESGPIEVQRTLFERSEPKPKQKRFNLSGVSDDEFFNEAEAKVVEALRSYAEKATNGQRLQRRLFTEDAVRGFAFVDSCHKRFDVVLMNPPFGEASKLARNYIDDNYTDSKNDLYATFVARTLSWLCTGGVLGAITSRNGYFIISFKKWREASFLRNAHLECFADLGHGVLDTAMVEAAAYCLFTSPAGSDAAFFRLLQQDEKAEPLRDSIDHISKGLPSQTVYFTDTSSFQQIPGSPFAYWISPGIRNLFRTLARFENERLGRTTRCGLGTLNDFRFLRLRWEVPTLDESGGWRAYYHGGSNSPFFDEFPMVVRWANNGEEIKQYVEEKVGSASRKVQGVDHYFLPGIVFPRRTSSFCPKVMPEGGIYSTAGQSVFVPPDQLWSSLAILSSLVCDFLISLSQGVVSDKISGTNPQFEVGLVDRLPWPDVPAETRTLLEQLAKRIVKLKLEWANVTEPSSYFFRALLPTECGLPLADIAVTRSAIQQKHTRSITEAQSQIDELAADVFGLSQSERAEVNRSSRRGYNIPMDDRETGVLNSEDVASLDDAVTPSAVTESVMSYCVGVIFGRWDVRHQTNMTDETPLLDPYLPIPLLAPGILLEGNLPFSGKCSADYPIRIDGDGIMVDDADHTDDIMRRVRDVLELIWRGRAGAIEKESCEILKIKELREYFRRPSKGGFWDNHITRFSKGRRKAPIYWLLQSSKKNYGLWFYYHRLDKDLLFKALVNYVEPKLRLEDSRLDSLRSQKAATVDSGTAAKKIDKEIEKQEDLISELRDFEDKLRRAANLHLDPDLNDGVVLNIAPLHELVPWKEAKSYWNELIAGEYEWSSIGKQLREKGLVK